MLASDVVSSWARVQFVASQRGVVKRGQRGDNLAFVQAAAYVKMQRATGRDL